MQPDMRRFSLVCGAHYCALKGTFFSTFFMSSFFFFSVASILKIAKQTARDVRIILNVLINFVLILVSL
tara:strand:- start:7938 stop:8144 length:207 start_codon:yes stop_codon:yes gene_type:complete